MPSKSSCLNEHPYLRSDPIPNRSTSSADQELGNGLDSPQASVLRHGGGIDLERIRARLSTQEINHDDLCALVAEVDRLRAIIDSLS